MATSIKPHLKQIKWFRKKTAIYTTLIMAHHLSYTYAAYSTVKVKISIVHTIYLIKRNLQLSSPPRSAGRSLSYFAVTFSVRRSGAPKARSETYAACRMSVPAA